MDVSDARMRPVKIKHTCSSAQLKAQVKLLRAQAQAQVKLQHIKISSMHSCYKVHDRIKELKF